MRTDGCKHTEGTHHDCAWVDERNQKIPAAEAYANRMWGRQPPLNGVTPTHENEVTERWAADWNTAFHYAMGLSWSDDDEIQIAPEALARLLNEKNQ